MADDTTTTPPTPAPARKAAPAPSAPPSDKASLVAELLAPRPVVEPPAVKREGPPTVAEHLEATLLECSNGRERGDVRFFHAGAATMQGWSPDQQISAEVYAAGVRAFASVQFNAGTPPEKA
jgi:hypothetical protein